MTDFALRRTVMVDTQVRPSDVTKYPVIEAMLSVPREEFVPEDLREAAYAGENTPLGGGRVMLDPRTLAKLLDGLDIQLADKVLIVGAGLGYTVALVSRMADEVLGVEPRDDLATAAQAMLARNGTHDAVIEQAPLGRGAPAAAPFDRILIEGAVEHLPDTITAQLKEGGRIGAIFMDGALGTCRIGYKIDGAMNWRFAFNATAPVLPDFRQAEEFVL